MQVMNDRMLEELKVHIPFLDAAITRLEGTRSLTESRNLVKIKAIRDSLKENKRLSIKTLLIYQQVIVKFKSLLEKAAQHENELIHEASPSLRTSELEIVRKKLKQVTSKNFPSDERKSPTSSRSINIKPIPSENKEADVLQLKLNKELTTPTGKKSPNICSPASSCKDFFTSELSSSKPSYHLKREDTSIADTSLISSKSRQIKITESNNTIVHDILSLIRNKTTHTEESQVQVINRDYAKKGVEKSSEGEKYASKVNEKVLLLPENSMKNIKPPNTNTKIKEIIGHENLNEDLLTNISILEALKKDILQTDHLVPKTDSNPLAMHEPKLSKATNCQRNCSKNGITIQDYKNKCVQRPQITNPLSLKDSTMALITDIIREQINKNDSEQINTSEATLLDVNDGLLQSLCHIDLSTISGVLNDAREVPTARGHTVNQISTPISDTALKTPVHHFNTFVGPSTPNDQFNRSEYPTTMGSKIGRLTSAPMLLDPLGKGVCDNQIVPDQIISNTKTTDRSFSRPGYPLVTNQLCSPSQYPPPSAYSFSGSPQATPNINDVLQMPSGPSFPTNRCDWPVTPSIYDGTPFSPTTSDSSGFNEELSITRQTPLHPYKVSNESSTPNQSAKFTDYPTTPKHQLYKSGLTITDNHSCGGTLSPISSDQPFLRKHSHLNSTADRSADKYYQVNNYYRGHVYSTYKPDINFKSDDRYESYQRYQERRNNWNDYRHGYYRDTRDRSINDRAFVHIQQEPSHRRRKSHNEHHHLKYRWKRDHLSCTDDFQTHSKRERSVDRLVPSQKFKEGDKSRKRAKSADNTINNVEKRGFRETITELKHFKLSLLNQKSLERNKSPRGNHGCSSAQCKNEKAKTNECNLKYKDIHCSNRINSNVSLVLNQQDSIKKYYEIPKIKSNESSVEDKKQNPLAVADSQVNVAQLNTEINLKHKVKLNSHDMTNLRGKEISQDKNMNQTDEDINKIKKKGSKLCSNKEKYSTSLIQNIAKQNKKETIPNKLMTKNQDHRRLIIYSSDSDEQNSNIKKKENKLCLNIEKYNTSLIQNNAKLNKKEILHKPTMKNKMHKRLIIYSSDSDDQNSNNKKKENELCPKKEKYYSTIIHNNTKQDKKETIHKPTKEKKKHKRLIIYSSDSDDQNSNGEKGETAKCIKKMENNVQKTSYHDTIESSVQNTYLDSVNFTMQKEPKNKPPATFLQNKSYKKRNQVSPSKPRLTTNNEYDSKQKCYSISNKDKKGTQNGSNAKLSSEQNIIGNTEENTNNQDATSEQQVDTNKLALKRKSLSDAKEFTKHIKKIKLTKSDSAQKLNLVNYKTGAQNEYVDNLSSKNTDVEQTQTAAKFQGNISEQKLHQKKLAMQRKNSKDAKEHTKEKNQVGRNQTSPKLTSIPEQKLDDEVHCVSKLFLISNDKNQSNEGLVHGNNNLSNGSKTVLRTPSKRLNNCDPQHGLKLKLKRKDTNWELSNETLSSNQTRNITSDLSCYTDKSYCFSADESTYTCRLCESANQDIVGHYKQRHPHSEIPLSRMHWQIAEKAIDESKHTDFESLKNTIINKFVCRFCFKIFKGQQKYILKAFYQHVVSTHTGEYENICPECNDEKECPFIQHIPRLPKTNGPLIGYICGQCNFTQISLDNLKTHIKVRHNDERTEVYVTNMSETFTQNELTKQTYSSTTAESVSILKSPILSNTVEKVKNRNENNNPISKTSDQVEKSIEIAQKCAGQVTCKNRELAEPNSVLMTMVQDLTLHEESTKAPALQAVAIFNSSHFKITYMDADVKQYSCCINSVESHFKTNLRISMKKHIQAKHQGKWNGYCSNCNMDVATQKGEYNYIFYFQHVIDIHEGNKMSKLQKHYFSDLNSTSNELNKTGERPNHEYVKETVKETMKTPVIELVKDFVENYFQKPMEETVETRLKDPVNTFVKEPSKKPDEKPVNGPMKKITKELVQERINEPVEGPGKKLIKELIKKNKEPLQKLVKELIKELVPEPMQEQERLRKQKQHCNFKCAGTSKLISNECTSTTEQTEAVITTPVIDKSPSNPNQQTSMRPIELPLEKTKPEEFECIPKHSEVMQRKQPSVLRDMMVNEKLVNLYKCAGQFCSFTSDSVEDALLHATTHSRVGSVGALECAYCSFECGGNVIDLVTHVFKRHGGCAFACGRCFYRAAAAQLVAAHAARAHPAQPLVVLASTVAHRTSPSQEPRDSTILPYICPHNCNYQTCAALKFCEHLQRKHPKETSHSCNICRARGGSPMELVAHMRIHGLNVYQCAWCVHGADSEGQLLDHAAVTHPERTLCAYVRLTTNENDRYDYKLMPLGLSVKVDSVELVTPKGGSDPCKEAQLSLCLQNLVNTPVSEDGSLGQPTQLRKPGSAKETGAARVSGATELAGAPGAARTAGASGAVGVTGAVTVTVETGAAGTGAVAAGARSMPPIETSQPNQQHVIWSTNIPMLGQQVEMGWNREPNPQLPVQHPQMSRRAPAWPPQRSPVTRTSATPSPPQGTSPRQTTAGKVKTTCTTSSPSVHPSLNYSQVGPNMGLHSLLQGPRPPSTVSAPTFFPPAPTYANATPTSIPTPTFHPPSLPHAASNSTNSRPTLYDLKYVCGATSCPFFTYKKDDFRVHWLMNHSTTPNFFCVYCSRSYPMDINRIIQHLQMHCMSSKQISDYNKQYEETIKNYQAANLAIRRKQEQLAAATNMLGRCPQCEFRTHQKQNLSEHMKMHQFQQCIACTFQASSSEHLRLHMSEYHRINTDVHFSNVGWNSYMQQLNNAAPMGNTNMVASNSELAQLLNVPPKPIPDKRPPQYGSNVQTRQV